MRCCSTIHHISVWHPHLPHSALPSHPLVASLFPLPLPSSPPLSDGPIDASEASPFSPFRDFWAGQAWDSFPGLLTLPVSPPFTQPRAYVLQLIDAVWAFHVALERIIDSQGEEGGGGGGREGRSEGRQGRASQGGVQGGVAWVWGAD